MDASGLKELGETIHNAMVDFSIRGGDWSPDLSGGCAVGSWLLQQEAKKKLDLDIEFHCNSNHAWNEFGNHIFDITATQYGAYDKVLIVPKSNLESVSNSWHRAMYTSAKREDISQVNTTWPVGQQPANYKIEWAGRYKARITFKDRRK